MDYLNTCALQFISLNIKTNKQTNQNKRRPTPCHTQKKRKKKENGIGELIQLLVESADGEPLDMGEVRAWTRSRDEAFRPSVCHPVRQRADNLQIGEGTSAGSAGAAWRWTGRWSSCPTHRQYTSAFRTGTVENGPVWSASIHRAMRALGNAPAGIATDRSTRSDRDSWPTRRARPWPL